jgi:hypothetical protein
MLGQIMRANNNNKSKTFCYFHFDFYDDAMQGFVKCKAALKAFESA